MRGKWIAGVGLAVGIACGGGGESYRTERLKQELAPADPVEVPVPTPTSPPGDISGTYDGKLEILQGEGTILVGLSDVFGNAHLCECAEEGKAVADGNYELEGFSVKVEDGRVWVSGTPACCGAGFPGYSYRIRDAAPLTKCTVTAERVPFRRLNPWTVGEETGAYVVKGDSVEVGTEVEGHRMARFIGEKRTVGLLSAGDLSCP